MAIFLDFLNLEIVNGISTDEAIRVYDNPVYVSESFSKAFIPSGHNPIGKPINVFEKSYEDTSAGKPSVIAGVVNDIYVNSLQVEGITMLLLYKASKRQHSKLFVCKG
jgi:hypothetical protein